MEYRASTCKKAFTLVELAVVIAVIAVLVAVLIPTFSSILHKSETASDQVKVSNFNKTISSDKINKDYNVIYAIKALLADGYSLDDLTLENSDNRLVYNSESNCMIIYDSTFTNVVYGETDEDISNLIVIGIDYLETAYNCSFYNFCVYSIASELSIETDYAITIWLYTEAENLSVKTPNATIYDYSANNNVNNCNCKSYYWYSLNGELLYPTDIQETADSGEQQHEHNYVEVVVEATVDKKTYTLYTCTCGESYETEDSNSDYLCNVDLKLSQDESYYIVTGLTYATDTEVYIPTSQKDIPVKEIAENAFQSNTIIENVYMGSNIETIGKKSFYQCTCLKTCSISNNVTTISQYAFCDCSSLTGITIPQNVTTIGSNAFCNCTALTEINFNATAMSDLSSNNYVFSKAGQSGDGIIVTIGSNVTKIPAYLFCATTSTTSTYSKIKTLIFEENSICENIGAYSFYNCSELKNISLPNKITLIDKYAFSGCCSFESLTIPDSVTSIGEAAFSGCSSIKSITLPFVGKNKDTTGSSSVFGYIFGTSSYNASEQTRQYYSSSGSQTYYIPSSLKTVTITGNVTDNTTGNLVSYSIPYGAFYGCSLVTSITIGENVTSINNYAFYNCKALTEINFNAKKLTDLQSNNYIFANAGTSGNGITVNIGAKVTKIPSYLFYPSNNYTPKIVKVSFEEESSCESIGDYALYNCTTLISINLPSNITIGTDAFKYCQVEI